MDLTKTDYALFRERLMVKFGSEVVRNSGLLDITPSRHYRRQLSEIDFEFFLRFYLPHHFYTTPASYQRQTYATIEDALEAPGEAYEVFCWPRGGGKTTTLLLGLPLYCIAHKKRHCIPIVADSHDQAKMHLGTLKSEIENNERIREDFGVLIGPKWQEDNIVTSNEVQVFALGHGMKIRGRKYKQYRPDLMLVDDPEDLEAAMSPAQSESLEKWVLHTLLPAGWRDTKVFVIGNIIHFNCLVNKLLQAPNFRGRTFSAIVRYAEREDLWTEWKRRFLDMTVDPKLRAERAKEYFEAHREEMLRGTEVAWPEAFTYYDLMVKRATIGDTAFATEYMNDPEDIGMRYFKRWHEYRRELRSDGEWLVPCDGSAASRLDTCYLFAGTDPSMGEQGGSDPSAILVVARTPQGRKFVLEADIQRRPPDTIITNQEDWFKRYSSIQRWLIEKTQFQAFFASEARKRAMEQGLSVPYKPVDSLSNKVLRIQSLQPAIENGEILFNEMGQERIKREMRRWQPYKQGQEDDGLDCLEKVVKEADEWGNAMGAVETTEADIHEFSTDYHLDELDDLYREMEDETLPVRKAVFLNEWGEPVELELCIPRIA